MVTLRAWPSCAEGDLVQIDAEVLEDGLGAGQHGDILEHGLAAVAVTGGLHGRDLQYAFELVDHQRREHLALDILGDDQQLPLRLGHLLQQRNQLGDGADFLLVHQDQRLLELADHLVRVGHEMRRKVPAVELHALDELDVRLEALALLDRNHAILADPDEGVGHDLADLAVVVGGNGCDVDDVGGFVDAHRLGERDELFDDSLGRRLHAAFQRHGIRPGRQIFVCLSVKGLGQDGRGGRAVAGDLGSLAGGLLYELGPEVLGPVRQLDLLGDGYAVLRYGRAAPALVDDGIPAAWAEGRLDRRRQLFHPG